MKVIPSDVIDRYREEKLFNELELGSELYKLYEAKPELIKPVRLIGTTAVKFLCDVNQIIEKKLPKLSDKEAKFLDVVVSTYADENALKIWGPCSEKLKALKSEIKKLEKMKKEKAKNINTQEEEVQKREKALLGGCVKSTLNALQSRKDLTPAECGDIMRLFSTVAEEIDNYDQKVKTESEKLSLNLGIYRGQEKLADFGGYVNLRGAYRTAWGPVPFARTRRTRDLVELKLEAKEILDRLQGDLEGTVTGITRWKLKAGSTVGSMDQLFGLPKGADISGTTADATYALETLMNIIYAKEINQALQTKKIWIEAPYIMLLPLVSMVSQYHHTILECALTLTTLDYIKYAIGFYTTLHPNMREVKKGGVAKELYDILEKYEQDRRNLHMLVFDSKFGGEMGVKMETEEEIQKYKAFVTMTKARYNYFDERRHLRTYRYEDVKGIVEDIRKGGPILPEEAIQREMNRLEK